MAKIKIEFDGLDKILEKYEKMEKNLKPVVTRALEESFNDVTPGIEKAMKPHHRTGDTEESIFKNPDVEWNGNVGSVNVGFDLNNGGMPSQYLIYGARESKSGIPERPPDMKLYNAIFGKETKRKIENIQKKVFKEMLKND